MYFVNSCLSCTQFLRHISCWAPLNQRHYHFKCACTENATFQAKFFPGWALPLLAAIPTTLTAQTEPQKILPSINIHSSHYHHTITAKKAKNHLDLSATFSTSSEAISTGRNQPFCKWHLFHIFKQVAKCKSRLSYMFVSRRLPWMLGPKYPFSSIFSIFVFHHFSICNSMKTFKNHYNSGSLIQQIDPMMTHTKNQIFLAALHHFSICKYCCIEQSAPSPDDSTILFKKPASFSLTHLHTLLCSLIV